MDLVPSFAASAISGYSAKSALFTVAGADKGKFFDCTGSFTITLTAAATLGAGFSFWVRNVSGSQVIDPDAAELISGASTYTVSNAGDVVLVECTGTAFVVAHTQLPSGVAITGGTISGVTHAIVTSGFTSTLASGSPLVVTATGLCSNVNVQYLNSQSGAYYTDASNLGTGTLPDARLSTTGVTSGSYTSASITVNSAGRITTASNGAGATQATATEVANQDAVTSYISPDRAIHNPGVAKSWVRSNSSGSIQDSHGVSSVTITGTTAAIVALSVTSPNSSYAIAGIGFGAAGAATVSVDAVSLPGTSSYRLTYPSIPDQFCGFTFGDKT